MGHEPGLDDPCQKPVPIDCRFKNQWCLDVSSRFYLKQARKILKTNFDLEKQDAVSLAWEAGWTDPWPGPVTLPAVPTLRRGDTTLRPHRRVLQPVTFLTPWTAHGPGRKTFT